jgi:cold shock CspA family protein/ribosome-associated translation inhibitor RaiA
VKIPLQITWRDLPPSEAVEAAVREKAAKLDEFCDDIMSCRVMVESPHQHHHTGKLYHLRIDLTVPGDEIVIRRDPSEDATHEDVYVVIRDAFDAAKRQLEDYVRRRRGDVKTHPTPRRATVVRMFPSQDYGFLRTPDGREIYFHRNSLVDADFDHLDPGTEVHYVEEEGEQGPQAASVTLGKRKVTN